MSFPMLCRKGYLRPALVLAWLLCALVVGGCAGSPQTTESAGRPVSLMRVGLSEWAITTPDRALLPGDVTFRVTNVGASAHDFIVRGRLGDWKTPVLDPGEQAELMVEVGPGEQLDLDCGLPGHHAAGMHTKVSVVEEPSTSPGGDEHAE
jgi:hypothetical protein